MSAAVGDAEAGADPPVGAGLHFHVEEIIGDGDGDISIRPIGIFDSKREAVTVPAVGQVDAPSLDAVIEAWPHFVYLYPCDRPLAECVERVEAEVVLAGPEA